MAFSHSPHHVPAPAPRAMPTQDVSRYHIRLKTAHTILVQACLGALLRLNDHIDCDSMKSFPLARSRHPTQLARALVPLRAQDRQQAAPLHLPRHQSPTVLSLLVHVRVTSWLLSALPLTIYCIAMLTPSGKEVT